MKTDFSPRLQYIAPLVGAAIAAGVGELAGTALSGINAGALNRRAEKYNWDMWNVQRQAQIQDWWRTQAYNSPENQMKLYKEAGLNPNLIYGSQGGFQGAGLQSPPSGQSLNLKQTDYSGMGNAVGKYFNTQIQQVMVQNQVKTNQLLDAQINKTNTEADAIRTGIGKTTEEITGLKISNYISEATKDVKIAIEKGSLTMQRTNIDATYARMINDIASTSTSISEAITRMAKNVAETNVQEKSLGVMDTTIMLNKAHAAGVELENAYMKKYGVKMPQQNFLVSMMAQLLETIKGKIGRDDIPKSYTPLGSDDSLYNYFMHRNTDSMKSGDYHKPVTK